MAETLLNKISKHPNNTYITDAWLTGQAGEIVDLKGDCIFRFVDYDTEGELRIKHTTEESQLSCPIVACGVVGYWLHKKDTEGTKAIFDGYYELCLKNYEKAHECDDDAWERDLKKEFVCSHHVPTEKKWIKASEALFPYITENDKKKVKSIMANYLKYANSKRIDLYPEDETIQNDNSDFEHLRNFLDRPDLDFYLSEEHWNFHVNTLLYKNLLVFHEGKEVGAFLDVRTDSFTQPINDYAPLYGMMFNEAYRLCNKVLTTPIPQTKVAWFANQAATWKFRDLKDEDGKPIELVPNVTDLIESYHILGMVNAILTFSNIQKEIVNEFLIALSVYNDRGLYFCGNIHRFEPYNEVYEAFILANMVNGNHLCPKYDNKSRDEYLRHNIPWYEHLASMLEKEKRKTEAPKTANIQEQRNNKCNVFNGPVTIIKNRATSPHQERRSRYWFDYNNRVTETNAGKTEHPIEGEERHRQKKSGAKETKFVDYIINNIEAEKVIDIIKQKINKSDAKQTALVIIGGIEAGKIRRDVTAPSIGKEFGVNGNSIKPHLTRYRAYKNGQNNSFSEEELKPYKDFFSK